MKTITYDKLVRDNIPDILQCDGCDVVYHIADDTEFKMRLINKLKEELAEVLIEIEENNIAWVREEVADLFEVMYAVCDLFVISKEEIEIARQNKLLKKGGFTKRIVVENVLDPYS